MSQSLASLIGALAASTALACAGSALAEPMSGDLGAGYSSVDAPLGAPTELQIKVSGRIAPRCEVGQPSRGLDAMDVGRSGVAEGVFGIDCNTPFIFRVRSASGGFASDSRLDGVQTVAPYQLQVELGTDQGRQNLGWCDAATLSAVSGAAGACAFSAASAEGGWSSRDAIAIEETGTLKLRWDAPSEGQARLGAYHDTIIIELEVRS